MQEAWEWLTEMLSPEREGLRVLITLGVLVVIGFLARYFWFDGGGGSGGGGIDGGGDAP